MPASRIFRFARTSRWAIVGSGTRKARAISGVVRPPRVRSVSATRASIASAGWQHVKISRSRSSGMPLTSSSLPPSASRRASFSRVSVLRRRFASRRRRSIARRLAVVVIHAPGLSGTPSRGHVSERADERLLDGFLGQVEVVEDTDQGRDRPPLLPPEQAADDLVRLVVQGDLALGLVELLDGPDLDRPAQRARASSRPPRAPGPGPCTRAGSSRRAAPSSRRTVRRS